MTPETAIAAAITALGGILVAIVGWVSSRQTIRSSVQARATERDDERADNLIANWERLYAEQAASTAQARQRADAAHATAEQARDTAEQAQRDLRDEQKARQSLEVKLKSAFGYIRALLAVLRTHDIAAPDPPDDLDIWP